MSYGCHNREPFKDGYHVKDLPHSEEHFFSRPVNTSVWIDHVMTRDCQYTLSQLGQQDPKCIGCKWRAS